MRSRLCILCCALIMCACSSSPEVCSVSGVIVDAYNNTVMIQQSDSSEVWVELDETTDLSECVGIEVGQTIKVECVVENSSTGDILHAVKINVPAVPYEHYLVGSWVEHNPLAPDQIKGFRLMEDGSAKSINTAGVVYEGWLVRGRNLVLLCVCDDAQRSYQQQLVYVIRSVDEKTLTLESESGDKSYVYSRQ